MSALGLTHRQADLLAFICGFQRAKGYSPSGDEMCVALGTTSKSSMQGLLAGLEERGVIRRLHHRVRAIEVLAPPPSVSRASDGAPLYFVPVLRQTQDERVVKG